MDDIYYLVHTTDNPNFMSWDYLKVSKFNTDDQFPGVYFSIITKDNIDKELIYPSKYVLLFSKKLLQQNNYHINYDDHNGIIDENNTYYPWNLDSFIKKIQKNKNSNKRTSNEVIFHDNISMKYLCGTIQRQAGIKINTLLPREPIENDELPDLSKKPFYCYPFESIYTIEGNFPPSSEKWYRMMAQVCGVDVNENDNNMTIEKKITDNANNLYINRDKQDIELLKQYTLSNVGGKNKYIKKNNKITIKSKINKYNKKTKHRINKIRKYKTMKNKINKNKLK